MTTYIEAGQSVADFFDPLLMGLDEQQYSKVLTFITELMTEFPELEPIIAWKQPMFTAHGTFVIGMSFATKHISLATHQPVFEASLTKLDALGLTYGKKLFRVPWERQMPLELIFEMVRKTLEEKKGYTKFW